MEAASVSRIGVLVMAGLLSALAVAIPTVATQPEGPVTIVTQIDFSEFPFDGTFEVTEGASLLGCAGGTFVDIPLGVIQKFLTCTEGGSGAFTVNFLPLPAPPGPGDLNGQWQVREGSGDFSGLQGSGDFSVVFSPETQSGTETLTGTVHFH